jgi:hypothetical protein
MQAFQKKAVVPFLLGLFSACALAQTPAQTPAAQTPAPSSVAPQFNDADKKKIAEIEQRPEVKDEIQAQWDEVRRRDLNYIYNVNSSAHFSDLSGPEFATFREHYGQLYNNPMLQRYLNAIGQRLVPKDSPNIYSFKILLDPIPKAESFSTGTVLVSTGLISMLDNEAQLAYVLGHEIAHVERNHFYEATRMRVIEAELNKEKQESTDRKRAIFTAAVTAATAGLGTGAANGLKGTLIGGVAGLGSGVFLGKLIFRDRTTVTEWPDVYENDADEASLGYVLDQNYDVREAPKLYARMETEAAHDPRIGLGFIAQATRMKARNAKVQEALSGTLKATIEAKLKAAGGLTGSSGEFNLIMATLKRDNGIIAIDNDLFAMAKDNLEEAVNLRTNDARAQLYLGKIISLTARNADERQEAEQHFMKAIQYDEERGAYPDPHLEHALHLIGENGDKGEIRKEIESYVALYQRQHAGSLPNNMPILYDYLTLVGENNWYAAPAAVVSTKNVEAIRTSNSGSSAGLTGLEVIAAATGSSLTPASTTPAPAPAIQPVSKTRQAPKKASN